MAKRTKFSLSFKVDVNKKFEDNPSTTKKALAGQFKIPESTQAEHLSWIIFKRNNKLLRYFTIFVFFV